jgi:hypothetical protein
VGINSRVEEQVREEANRMRNHHKAKVQRSKSSAVVERRTASDGECVGEGSVYWLLFLGNCSYALLLPSADDSNIYIVFLTKKKL